MIGNEDWQRYLYTLEVDKSKKVKSIDFNLLANDVEGTLQFTDLQLQEGTQVSGNIPATQDLLEEVSFNIDEFAFMKTVSNPIKYGSQPIYHENVKNRFYNILGRGHDVVSIPNVFHEDYTFPLVTTGLDLELYPKEDFDLLRIRTNDGTVLEEPRYGEDLEHPLNCRYTREFFFDGGKEGDQIDLKATIRSAKLKGKDVPLKQHNITLSKGDVININRQRFMMAPSGSFRLGIEFYKKVNGVLVDAGIGYHGIAELNQWTYGVSKL